MLCGNETSFANNNNLLKRGVQRDRLRLAPPTLKYRTPSGSSKSRSKDTAQWEMRPAARSSIWLGLTARREARWVPYSKLPLDEPLMQLGKLALLAKLSTLEAPLIGSVDEKECSTYRWKRMLHLRSAQALVKRTRPENQTFFHYTDRDWKAASSRGKYVLALISKRFKGCSAFRKSYLPEPLRPARSQAFRSGSHRIAAQTYLQQLRRQKQIDPRES